MSEETLPGGRTDGAVRIGDVVHKQAAPPTPPVHALLQHLEEAGVDGVPRALGFDEQGRQMLTYLPGEMIGDRDPWPAWVYTDSTLVQVGQWMRRVHEATATFVPPEDECWFTGRPMQPGMFRGHSALAWLNAGTDGGRRAGRLLRLGHRVPVGAGGGPGVLGPAVGAAPRPGGRRGARLARCRGPLPPPAPVPRGLPL